MQRKINIPTRDVIHEDRWFVWVAGKLCDSFAIGPYLKYHDEALYKSTFFTLPYFTLLGLDRASSRPGDHVLGIGLGLNGQSLALDGS